MPHVIIKKVWDYCSYNKGFLLFILALLFVSSLIQNHVRANGDYYDFMLIRALAFIVLSGYGMLITRSRINHGMGLPNIYLKDIISLGIKSGIVNFIYLSVQGALMAYVCHSLGFPSFDLMGLLLNWSDTIDMLFSHDPVSTILFVVVGAATFYISTFFMEIALAKLADTKSIWPALNLLSIKRSIDVVGWRNYAKDYTLIVLAIVILTYLISLDFSLTYIDSIIDMFLSFLIFATQYLGIGAVYCEIKDLESGHCHA